MKFYVVWAGRKKGVFASWDECKANIQGFPGAKFKSFGSRARAEAEFRGETLLPTITGKDGPQLSIAVDGACSGSIGEYRGVLLPSKVQIFRMGPWEHCTNNIMEVHVFFLVPKKIYHTKIFFFYNSTSLQLGGSDGSTIRGSGCQYIQIPAPR